MCFLLPVYGSQQMLLNYLLVLETPKVSTSEAGKKGRGLRLAVAATVDGNYRSCSVRERLHREIVSSFSHIVALKPQGHLRMWELEQAAGLSAAYRYSTYTRT